MISFTGGFSMKRSVVCVLIAFLVLVPCGILHAQKKKKFLRDAKDKVIFDQAEAYFEDGKFDLAEKKYKPLYEKYPEEPVLHFRLGVCLLNEPGGLEKATEMLQKLDREKFKKTDLCYYLGRVYHMNYRFEDAIRELETCIASKYVSNDQKEIAQKYVVYCRNGIELLKDTTKAKIINLGPGINTTASEYVPAISSDESILMFTYRGERSIGGLQNLPGLPDPEGDYFEDIMVSYADSNGKWSPPEHIKGQVNTDGHDACISLSNDGQKVFVFKNPPEDPGQLGLSFQDSSKWIEPELLKGDVVSTAWEGHVSLTSNERALYFSSERPGGLGGKDIYLAHLSAGDEWRSSKNLGSVINTADDDDSPFIHPNGIFLVFASKGHNSMGGYDLFYSELQDDSTWSKPVNLGHPINTPGDDIYFTLSANGKHGYYSSARPGGYGLQDIYLIDDPFPKRFLVYMVKGVVTVDGIPVRAEVQVYNAGSGALYTTVFSNAVTGKYLVNLPKGMSYRLRFKFRELESDKNFLSTLGIEDFVEKNMDISLFSEEYLKRIAMLKTADSLSHVNDTVVNVKMKFTEVLKVYGMKKVEDLEFRIQVGAYEFPQNFRNAALKQFGKVTKLKLEDQVTRFTVGHFYALKEAYDLRDEVVKAGITDAFVTAIYKGKRIYLQQVVDLLTQ